MTKTVRSCPKCKSTPVLFRKYQMIAGSQQNNRYQYACTACNVFAEECHTQEIAGLRWNGLHRDEDL